MAKVIDIRGVDVSTISSEEVFAIDTNALLWTHYSKASNPNLNRHPYQVIEYPNLINKLIQNGNRLVTTTLNITELFVVVEKNEHRIYNAVNAGRISIKDFRKIASERNNYKAEIDNMILEIKSSYDSQIEIIELGEEIITSFQNNICHNTCDVFDYAVIEYLKKRGIVNYISDDKDFLSIAGINLYTTYEI